MNRAHWIIRARHGWLTHAEIEDLLVAAVVLLVWTGIGIAAALGIL